MSELITPETLLPILDEVRIAFRTRIPQAEIASLAKSWFKSVAGLRTESVQAAADQYMRTGQNFPRIKEIRELALKHAGITTPQLDRRRDDLDVCGICGARYEDCEVETREVVIVKLENGHTVYCDRFDAEGKPALNGRGGVRWIRVQSPVKMIFHDRAAHGLQ